MKRAFALFLSVIVCLSFASCKKNKKPKNSNSTDISYYADLGTITECKVKLGDNAKELIKTLEAEYEKSEENYYTVIDGETDSKIATTNTHYIYNNDDGLINCIVLFDKAYGFSIGTDMETIKNAEKDFDLEGKEISLSEEEARTFSGNEFCTYLMYEFDKNTVIFAFEDNALIGTLIKTNKK